MCYHVELNLWRRWFKITNEQEAVIDVMAALMDITRGRKPGLKWAQLRACNGAPSKALELDRTARSLQFIFRGQWVSASLWESFSPEIPIRVLSLCIVQYTGLFVEPPWCSCQYLLFQPNPSFIAICAHCRRGCCKIKSPSFASFLMALINISTFCNLAPAWTSAWIAHALQKVHVYFTVNGWRWGDLCPLLTSFNKAAQTWARHLCCLRHFL